MSREGITRIGNRFLSWEEINGDGLCPTYLYRLVLLRLPRGRRLYLHRFVGDDWALDPHDHPKSFLCIGLWGAYDEDVYDPIANRWTTRRWRAPWIPLLRCRPHPSDPLSPLGRRLDARLHGTTRPRVGLLDGAQVASP